MSYITLLLVLTISFQTVRVNELFFELRNSDMPGDWTDIAGVENRLTVSGVFG